MIRMDRPKYTLWMYKHWGCSKTLFKYFGCTNTEDMNNKDVQTLWMQHLEYAYAKDMHTLGLFTKCRGKSTDDLQPLRTTKAVDGDGKILWMDKVCGWTNTGDEHNKQLNKN